MQGRRNDISSEQNCIKERKNLEHSGICEFIQNISITSITNVKNCNSTSIIGVNFTPRKYPATQSILPAPVKPQLSTSP